MSIKLGLTPEGVRNTRFKREPYFRDGGNEEMSYKTRSTNRGYISEIDEKLDQLYNAAEKGNEEAYRVIDAELEQLYRRPEVSWKRLLEVS